MSWKRRLHRFFITLLLGGLGCSAYRPALSNPLFYSLKVFYESDVDVDDLENNVMFATKMIERDLNIQSVKVGWTKGEELPMTLLPTSALEGCEKAAGMPEESEVLLCVVNEMPSFLTHGVAANQGWLVGRRSSISVNNGRVIAHELGHVFGLGHSLFGVMHPDALVARLATGFSWSSRRKIYWLHE